MPKRSGSRGASCNLKTAQGARSHDFHPITPQARPGYAARMDTDSAKHSNTIIRDVLILQCKLFVEALRDVILSPIALGAALLDLAMSKQQAPRYFHQVLRWGKRSDEWIDPWSAAEKAGSKHQDGLNALLAQVEVAVSDPAQGARRARVLKRWAERQLTRARRRIENGQTTPPSPPPG